MSHAVATVTGWRLALFLLLVQAAAGCSGGAGFSGKGKKSAADAPPPAPQPSADATPGKELGNESVSETTPESEPESDLPAPAPTPEIVQIDLQDCVRHFACALSGTEPGRHHPTISLPQRPFLPDEVIEITYQNPSFGSGDWITIVPKHYEDNSWCPWFWSEYSSGSHRFRGLPAGEYELRAYYGWKERGECEVVTRIPVTVREP